MRKAADYKKNFISRIKSLKNLNCFSFKQFPLAAACLATLSACAVVPNEGPTDCGLESFDNALFRDEGCDPITGIISIPSMLPIWIVDYSACGLKWHNSRIAPDFNGRKVRYLRRLKQLKLEAERNQSAVNAQRALASESLAENAIADNLNRLLMAKNPQASSTNFSPKRSQAAKIMLENGVSEKFTKALEQMMRIENNLKLAHERALAEMPQDQDLLPALATPDAKESSSYSVLELEKTAWAQVTEEDKAKEKIKREQKMAAWPQAKRQAYEQKQAEKERKAKAKQERRDQKQAALEAKLAQKNAQKEAKRQEKLKAKGMQEAQPMNPSSASEAKAPAPATPPAESRPAENTAGKGPAQIDHPMIPVVRKAETVKAKSAPGEG